jgi:hypothetical protein
MGKTKKKVEPSSATKRVSVDIVTGRSLVTVYFDPYAAIDCQIPSNEWLGKNMYIPAGIVKTDESANSFLVKLPSGELFKLPQSAAFQVHPQVRYREY